VAVPGVRFHSTNISSLQSYFNLKNNCFRLFIYWIRHTITCRCFGVVWNVAWWSSRRFLGCLLSVIEKYYFYTRIASQYYLFGV